MSETKSAPVITIRDLVMEDLEAVHDIEKRLFASPWSMTSYRFEVTNPMAQNWVVEAQEADEKRIIGMIVVWMLIDQAYIANIGVDVEYQQKGIGCQLLKHALERCAGIGAVSAALEVREGNLAALALYNRFGFEKVGLRKGYYHDNNEDALLFTLKELQVEKISKIDC